jgi:hypothetical protein
LAVGSLFFLLAITDKSRLLTEFVVPVLSSSNSSRQQLVYFLAHPPSPLVPPNHAKVDRATVFFLTVGSSAAGRTSPWPGHTGESLTVTLCVLASP